MALTVERCAEYGLRLWTAARSHDPRATLRAMTDAAQWLVQFGYLSDKTIDVDAAVSRLQERFGLPCHGILDAATMSIINRPRCGCPDFARPETESHAGYLRMMNRMEVLQAQWRKRSLKYYVAAYVPGISQDDQLDTFAAAWRSWVGHCLVDVERTNNPQTADIVIATGQGRRSQFDGPGGTLAWAELPPGNDQPLQMRFDLGETWTMKADRIGVWLLPVAAHEFGHLLGLDHSDVESALMAPYYNPAVSAPQPVDDVSRVQALYGARTPQPGPGTDAGEVLTIRVHGRVEIDGYTIQKTG